MTLVVIFAVICGLLIGSFLSVVVTRYETDETVVRGRSRCRSCGNVIRWYDNVPLLSYVLLRGKCRSCAERIIPFYPAIEVTTAVVFVAVAVVIFLQNDAHVTNVFWRDVVTGWLIVAGLITIFFYDLRTMHIPMRAAWYSIGVLMVYGAVRYGVWSDMAYDALVMRVLGGGVGFLFLYFLSAFSRERWMGAGDAYVGFIGGVLSGWPAVLFFLTASFGIGAIVSIAMIAFGVRTRKDAVPFAPFLIVGMTVTILFPLLFPKVALLLPYF